MPKFLKHRLPSPGQYYSLELEKYKEGPIRASACCPFHKDTNPSFSVDLHRGSYRCYSCGERGQGIIDFQMARYGQDFKEAAKALGAWG